MVKVLKVVCETSVPEGEGFFDEGTQNSTVYILATVMTDKQLSSCLKTYWSQTEATMKRIVSQELCDMPEFTWASKVATYDGDYGLGFLVVDNPMARAIFYRIRQSLWRRGVDFMCETYNWATKPNRLMTEKESKACARMAKMCRKFLEGKKFRENEDGTLVSEMEHRWQ